MYDLNVMQHVNAWFLVFPTFVPPGQPPPWWICIASSSSALSTGHAARPLKLLRGKWDRGENAVVQLRFLFFKFPHS